MLQSSKVTTTRLSFIIVSASNTRFFISEWIWILKESRRNWQSICWRSFIAAPPVIVETISSVTFVFSYSHEAINFPNSMIPLLIFIILQLTLLLQIRVWFSLGSAIIFSRSRMLVSNLAISFNSSTNFCWIQLSNCVLSLMLHKCHTSYLSAFTELSWSTK